MSRSDPEHRLERMRRRYVAAPDMLALELSGVELDAVPPWVFDRDLRWLDLHDNQLTELPAELGLLTWLEVLDLRDNRFTVVPQVLRELPSLTELYLDHNPLTALPDWLAELPSLEYVQAVGCPPWAPPPGSTWRLWQG